MYILINICATREKSQFFVINYFFKHLSIVTVSSDKRKHIEYLQYFNIGTSNRAKM